MNDELEKEKVIAVCNLASINMTSMHLHHTKLFY